jgi:acid phosphatase type 7
MLMDLIHSWFGLNAPLDPSKVPATATVDLAKNWPDAPILALGDIVYRRGTPDEFADCFDPIWRSLKSRTLPVPGNHEYYTPGAFAYYDYWGRQTGPDRRGYYAVATDHWLILALNSETDAGPDAAQTTWLWSVLENTNSPCILAFFHRPAYASEKRSGDHVARDLFRTLSAYDVDIVLNGHTHYYERIHPLGANGTVVPDGIATFVVGTGGRRPKTGLTPQALSETLIQGELGLLELELGAGRYITAFHAVGAEEPLDRTEATCRGS